MDIQHASSDPAADNTKLKLANSDIDASRILKMAATVVEGQSATIPRGLVRTSNDDDICCLTISDNARNDCFIQSDNQLSAKNKILNGRTTDNEEQTVGGLDIGLTKLKRIKWYANKRSCIGSARISGKRLYLPVCISDYHYHFTLDPKEKGEEKLFYGCIGKEGNKKKCTTEELVEKELVEDVLAAKETPGLQAGNSHQLLDQASLEFVPDEDRTTREPDPEMIIQEINKADHEERSRRKKRGRLQKPLARNQNGSVKGSEEILKEKLSFAPKATDGVDDGMPSLDFDEELFSKWLDEMYSTELTNYKGAFNGRALQPPDDASVQQSDVAMPRKSHLVLVNSDSVEKSLGLPFAKCSPIWNSIESLDVFQKTPQSPHFSPLVKCSEETHEGLAIGHMITFANLVERTSKLQISDPHSIIDCSMATLAELENHGFNVEIVRRRLNALRDMKCRVARIEAVQKQAEAEITKLNAEKNEFVEVINQVEIKMRQIQEKLASATSMRETKVQKIGVWQSKLNFLLQLMETIKHEFETVAASTL